MHANVPSILFAMMVALHFGCSCSGNPGSDADAVVDAPDGDAVEDTSNDTPSELDTAVDSDETDSDAAEIPSDCFLPFDGGYDLEGLGLEVIPRGRPSTSCGECCKQVSFADDELTYPNTLDVWGRYLVYSTGGDACGSDCWTRIVIADLSSGVEYMVDSKIMNPALPGVIMEGIAEPAILEQDIYYSHSTWTDISGDEILECEIMHYSLVSGGPTVLYSFESCADGCWCPSELDAFGDYLVWQDNRTGISGDQHVRMLEITSGVETTISGQIVLHPHIWNNDIVYHSGLYSVDTIEHYDIASGAIEMLTDGVHDRWYPWIWESLITWSDARAGGTQANQAYADIYMMDLEDDVEIPVCTDSASQFGSFVFGDLVVWSDLRNDPLYPNNYVAATNRDVYGYRISTGEEFQITDLPGKEWAMHLFDNHVFFLMEDDSGVESIFMKDVTPP